MSIDKSTITSHQEEPNLDQKLALIRKIADVAVKNKQGFNYSYADIVSILAKVTAGMNKYGISLVPMIMPNTTQVEQVTYKETKFDKQGVPYDKYSTEFLVRADMKFLWVDDQTGESREVPWAMVGAQSDPSQAFGSGLTYCTRYFLNNYFQIPQVDSDPDKYRSDQKRAAEAEDLELAKSIIAQFDTQVRMYLADNPNSGQDVSKMVKKYVKNGDYNLINNPELAAKLLGEFRATFLKGE
jgi:hypothetical protein